MLNKFSVSYSALNLPGMFWKMAKLENCFTQVTKAKFREKKCLFNLF